MWKKHNSITYAIGNVSFLICTQEHTWPVPVQHFKAFILALEGKEKSITLAVLHIVVGRKLDVVKMK